MIEISDEFVLEMIEHSRLENPNECCGILAGTGGKVTKLYRIQNSTPSPYRYVMDPNEQLKAMKDADERSLDLMAFYHSHTHSPAYPSDTDIRMATESGWVDFCYVLVSLEDSSKPDVRFFDISADGNVNEEEVKIT
jgi:proteasome lid subunit RPN8/RPN11